MIGSDYHILARDRLEIQSAYAGVARRDYDEAQCGIPVAHGFGSQPLLMNDTGQFI